MLINEATQKKADKSASVKVKKARYVSHAWHD